MLRSKVPPYFRNTSWLFLERMVRLVVVLVTGMSHVARYLGDSLFGQLNYATGFVGLFSRSPPWGWTRSWSAIW